MTLAVTGIYAALLALILVALSMAVSAKRGSTKISILHGDDMGLALRIRRHANFTENVPLALLVMVIAELQGAGPTWLHITGVVLVVSRIVHPLGMSISTIMSPLRLVGSLGTTVAILMSAGFILWRAISG